MRVADLFAGIGKGASMPWYICQMCGQQFRSYNPNPTFCSRRCKGTSIRHKVDTAKVIALYNSGYTQIEVGRMVGVTQKVVWATLRRAGVKARTPAKRNQYGPNNDYWAGDKGCYTTDHNRVRQLFGKPQRCEWCGSTSSARKYDWANLTGDYKNPHDYARLCRSCHFKYDRIILNIKHMNERRCHYARA